MSLARSPSLALAFTLAVVLSSLPFASPAHAETAWVQQVKQQLENDSDPYDALVTRCILVRAMLVCDFERAIELADQTITMAGQLDNPNVVAVANMLKSIALRESRGLRASTNPTAEVVGSSMVNVAQICERCSGAVVPVANWAL